MKGLVLDAEARTATVQDIPEPSPLPNEILINVKATSLNPIDPLYVRHPLARSGRTIGSDFAGMLSSLGSEVPASSNLKVGDRVAGFLQGACSANDRPGAFAELLTCPWDLVWKVPDIVDLEQAAGVSLVGLTAAQAIWYRLGLPTPFEYARDDVLAEHPNWRTGSCSRDDEGDTLNFFIYGASTSVGLLAAQMVRLCAQASGKSITLFGAASKARWEMLRSEPYLYDHLVDYRDDAWPEHVINLSKGIYMHYAYDCISEDQSVEMVASTLARSGRMAIVRSREGGAWSATNMTNEPIYGAVWEGLGEEVQYQGFTIPQSPAARQFAVEFYKWLADAVGVSLIPVPIRIMPGGLAKVVGDGFELLGSGSMGERAIGRSEDWMRPVSAVKLVYQI